MGEPQMTHTQLTAWRERLGWTKTQAAAALDLSPNSYGALEAGRYLDGRESIRPVRIKRHIALACAAIEHNLKPLK